MMNKIGIMGGTFNPIHNGHLMLADNAYKELKLDKILFMPSYIPPHKKNSALVKDEYRCKLIQIAIQNTDYFEFSDFEIKRNETTYTSKTLELLSINTNNDYYFLMGADSLMTIESWNRPQVVMNLSKIVVAVRDKYNLKTILDQKKHLEQKYGADIFVINTNKIDISSTDIRNKIHTNQPITSLVPKDIEQYVLSIYRNEDNYVFNDN